MLGVHPNTIRAWSDAGRLRYYRINPRGDRRYRLGDLQRFLAAAAGGPVETASQAPGQAGVPHGSGGPGGAPAAIRRPFEPHAVRGLLGIPTAGAAVGAAG